MKIGQLLLIILVFVVKSGVRQMRRWSTGFWRGNCISLEPWK